MCTNYFKEQWKREMFLLEHPKPSDFYISCWQTTRSSVPLLIFRILLFLTILGIVITSMTFYIQGGIYGYWFIYLTHWGLSTVLLSTGFAVGVSAKCYLTGPISAEFSLPWYVKVYWCLYNIAVPLAFLISIFYWTILYPLGQEEELNHALDVSVHGVNSILMLLLLLSSAHPCRLLHFYQPLVFALVYVIFGVIYYLAGGTDSDGNRYVYSVIHWAYPGTTLLYVAATGVLLVILYAIMLLLAAGRDLLVDQLIHKSVTVHVEEGVPLRHQTTTTTTWKQ